MLAAVQLLDGGSPPDRLTSHEVTRTAADATPAVPARAPTLSDAQATAVVQQLAAARAAAFVTADASVLDRRHGRRVAG